MGNYNCCGCTSFATSPVQRKIILLLVGLDNSGKTTAAKGLTGEVVDNSIPTLGFSTVKMKHKGFDVIIYDLGGGPQIRGIWSCYFSDVYGVIFVVDASDTNRLEEAKVLLHNLLMHEKLAGKPLLVLANKQDIPNALDEIDIVEFLRLEPLVNQQKCLTLVEVCSALSPENNEKIDSRLIRGYRWLVRQIINNYEELNQRVMTDMEEAQALVVTQREEWKKKRNTEIEQSTTITKTEHLTNGTMPITPVGDTNGFAHPSPNFSSRIKHQIEMAEKQRTRVSAKNKKINKVFPGNQNHDSTCDKLDEGRQDENSMVVRALTSPRFNTEKRQSLSVMPLRPITSKSLGNSEVKPWGLDQELQLVDHGVSFLNNNNTAQNNEHVTVEYFKNNEPNGAA